MTKCATKKPMETPPQIRKGPSGLPQRLSWARERLGLSLRVLATAARSSSSALHRIEGGQVDADVPLVWRLAKKLGISPSWLAYGDGGAFGK